MITLWHGRGRRLHLRGRSSPAFSIH
jgi:hypothetical protein